MSKENGKANGHHCWHIPEYPAEELLSALKEGPFAAASPGGAKAMAEAIAL